MGRQNKNTFNTIKSTKHQLVSLQQEDLNPNIDEAEEDDLKNKKMFETLQREIKILLKEIKGKISK